MRPPHAVEIRSARALFARRYDVEGDALSRLRHPVDVVAVRVHDVRPMPGVVGALRRHVDSAKPATDHLSRRATTQSVRTNRVRIPHLITRWMVLHLAAVPSCSLG